MVQTRNMIQQDKLLDHLTTPGILTQIISKLAFNDKGITGLYLLVNNEALRKELQPFVDNLSNHNHKKHLLRMEKIQQKKIERLKMKLVAKMRYYVNEIDLLDRTSQKLPIILEMFDYLENNTENLHLLGKTFGNSLNNSINRFIIDGTKKHLPDFVVRMHETRLILKDFIDWSLSSS